MEEKKPPAISPVAPAENKTKSEPALPAKEQPQPPKKVGASTAPKKRPLPDPSPLVPHISKHLGLLVMLVLASKWATYLTTIHENNLWFSNIRVTGNKLFG